MSDWMKTSANPQKLKDPERDELGPYQIQWESCECGGDYPCVHDSYPYQLISTSRVDARRGTPEYPELAVVANFVEAEHCTHSDAYLLMMSWRLYEFVRKVAAEGDSEAIQLVEMVNGQICECGEHANRDGMCDECHEYWENLEMPED